MCIYIRTIDMHKELQGEMRIPKREGSITLSFRQHDLKSWLDS